MWLPFRSRRSRAAARTAAEADGASVGPLAVRAERVLLAFAMHAQQLDERLAHVEQGLEARVSLLEQRHAERHDPDRFIDLATQQDLLEVQLHSARVSAELSRVAMELRARIDDLAVQMPAVVAEDQRLQRARTLAESILELSDSLDTGPADLGDEPGDWAATA